MDKAPAFYGETWHSGTLHYSVWGERVQTDGGVEIL